jgi:ribose/xylose/arabinose/galactoside ABC-type transport system permease subunit
VALAALMTVGQLGTASAGISNSLLLPPSLRWCGWAAITGGPSGGRGGICSARLILLLRIGLDIVGVPQEYQPIHAGFIISARSPPPLPPVG